MARRTFEQIHRLGAELYRLLLRRKWSVFILGGLIFFYGDRWVKGNVGLVDRMRGRYLP